MADFRHARLTDLVHSQDLTGVAYLAGHKHVTTTNRDVHPNKRAAERVLAQATGTSGPETPTTSPPTAGSPPSSSSAPAAASPSGPIRATSEDRCVAADRLTMRCERGELNPYPSYGTGT